MNYLAQITNPGIGSLDTGRSDRGLTFIQKLIPSLIGLAFVGGVLIFFFMLLLAAIQWVSSGGDKAAVEGARGRLSNALVGLVILFAAFAIVKLVENFFGISILAIDIGPFIIK